MIIQMNLLPIKSQPQIQHVVTVVTHSLPAGELHTWSELLVPLVNMIIEGYEYKCALLIILIFFITNPSFHWMMRI